MSYILGFISGVAVTLIAIMIILWRGEVVERLTLEEDPHA